MPHVQSMYTATHVIFVSSSLRLDPIDKASYSSTASFKTMSRRGMKTGQSSWGLFPSCNTLENMKAHCVSMREEESRPEVHGTTHLSTNPVAKRPSHTALKFITFEASKEIYTVVGHLTLLL